MGRPKLQFTLRVLFFYEFTSLSITLLWIRRNMESRTTRFVKLVSTPTRFYVNGLHVGKTCCHRMRIVFIILNVPSINKWLLNFCDKVKKEWHSCLGKLMCQAKLKFLSCLISTPPWFSWGWVHPIYYRMYINALWAMKAFKKVRRIFGDRIFQKTLVPFWKNR